MSLFHMRVSDPVGLGQLLAKRFVQRGIRWLNQNAPVGWHRNLFEPRPNGCSYYRARMRSNNESVLALSFERCPEYIDQFGYVSEYKVSKHFCLTEKRMLQLGFRAKAYPDVFRRADAAKLPYVVVVSDDMLDIAWEKGIASYGYPGVPHRHQTPAEKKRIAAMRSFGSRQSSLWQKIQPWFAVFGKTRPL